MARNVGLRSIWERGAWRVRLLFMDHDGLRIPTERFDPVFALRGGYYDAAHLLLDPPAGRRSVLDLLASVYRVGPAIAARGRSRCLRAARAACRRTRTRLAVDPALQALFHEPSRAAVLAWQEATAAFVRSRRQGLTIEASLRAGADLLRDRGQPDDTADAFLANVGAV